MRAHIELWVTSEEDGTDRDVLPIATQLREIPGVEIAECFYGSDDIVVIVEADAMEPFDQIVRSIASVPAVSFSNLRLVRST